MNARTTNNMNKGQLTLGIGTLIAGVTMTASILGAYFTSQGAIQGKISEVQLSAQQNIAETNLNVQANTTDIQGIKDRLDRIDGKIDALLENRGIDPMPFNIEKLSTPVQPVSTPLSVTATTT